jgi:hypothetical protein
MRKTASQIADEVLYKIAKRSEKEKRDIATRQGVEKGTEIHNKVRKFFGKKSKKLPKGYFGKTPKS